MVSMTEEASTSLQDSSQLSIQPIDGNGLSEIADKQEKDVCILDCRQQGSSLKNATKVQLPHVLLRRLQSGRLPLSNLSPKLCEDGEGETQIVVIPEPEAPAGSQTAILINALTKQQANRQIFLFTEDVEMTLSRHPSLRAPQPTPTEGIDGVKTPADEPMNLSFLRFDALRIKDLAGSSINITPRSKTNDKRQIFPVQILPYLYLGDAKTAGNKELLDSYGIHYVVNVTSNLENFFEDDKRFRYLRIPVDDNASFNLIQFFPEAISFIEEAEREREGCLVHCLAGISRSVTICLAFLMFTRKCTLEEAYDVVLGQNASIAPNFHFMGQLNDYEHLLGIQKSAPPPHSPSCSAEQGPLHCLTPPASSKKNDKGLFY